jgi:hypothetical protein
MDVELDVPGSHHTGRPRPPSTTNETVWLTPLPRPHARQALPHRIQRHQHALVGAPAGPNGMVHRDASRGRSALGEFPVDDACPAAPLG